MIDVDVPGTGRYQFHHLVLDVNGTIARDGELIDGVEKLLEALRVRLQIHLVTADTHGAQASIDRRLGLVARIIPERDQAEAKLRVIQELKPETVAAIGNGSNDALMLEHAALGIAVIGPEGAALEAILRAKIAVTEITGALELLLHPKRLIATMRR